MGLDLTLVKNTPNNARLIANDELHKINDSNYSKHFTPWGIETNLLRNVHNFPYKSFMLNKFSGTLTEFINYLEEKETWLTNNMNRYIYLNAPLFEWQTDMFSSDMNKMFIFGEKNILESSYEPTNQTIYQELFKQQYWTDQREIPTPNTDLDILKQLISHLSELELHKGLGNHLICWS